MIFLCFWGIAGDTIYPPRENGSAKICIDIINHLWTGIAKEILSRVKNNTGPDMAHCIETVELYRRVLERILEAPWGSLLLTDAQKLDPLITRLTYQIQKNLGSV